MATKKITKSKNPGSVAATNLNSQIRQEYVGQNALFDAQPVLVQRFLEAQGRVLADALEQMVSQVKFNLPDRVVCSIGGSEDEKVSTVPAKFREQLAGGVIDRLTGSDIRKALRQRLMELEQSENRAVATSAGLIRLATVRHMVYSMLPAGRSVNYVAANGEEIPSIPVEGKRAPGSAMTASTDAIVEEQSVEAGRGELQVPFVPAARKFYLPQWVSFDEKDQLLVNTIAEAEAHLAAMQRFLGILHAAVSLASYMVADEEYQHKRYGMLGQLVNQGRALARYQTGEIVQTIWSRAKAKDLNRGLSLSLPYFDDQDLVMRTYFFEIIPAGRIMFVPAFVVRAVRQEQAKVVQDTRLSLSTRRHLLEELKTLEQAFISQS